MASEPEPISGLAGKKILFVEDDVFLSDIIARKLATQNCKVLHAPNGEMALTIIEKEMPDIVLLDILLPGMNGFELLEKFKSDPKTQNIPVIILSNFSQESDIEKGKKLGAASYLVKAEVSTDEILVKIKEVLEDKKK